MTGLEFIVEFTKAYGSFLAYLWWPMVVLVIFFSLMYYFDRSLGSFGRRKRFPMTWKNMVQAVSQIERRYLNELANETIPPQRQLIVREQIQRAKNGLERHDEQEVVQSIMNLATMGLYGDQQIPPQITQDFTHQLESPFDEKKSTKK